MRSKSTYSVMILGSLAICSWLILANANPIDSSSGSFGFSSHELLQDGLTDQKAHIRPKRDLGLLRQICPTLAGFLQSIFNQIRKTIFQLIGQVVLGGGGRKPNGGGGGNVKVTLPTDQPETSESTETTTSGVETKLGGSSESSSESSSEASTEASSQSSSEASSEASSSESSSSEASSEASSESSSSEASTEASSTEASSSEASSTSEAPAETTTPK